MALDSPALSSCDVQLTALRRLDWPDLNRTWVHAIASYEVHRAGLTEGWFLGLAQLKVQITRAHMAPSQFFEQFY
jgi:hypothetical protein